MIKVSRIEDYAIVTPLGNSINNKFKNEILDYLKSGEKNIIINFINIEYADSLSLGILINLYTKLKELNINLKLTGVNDRIFNMLRQARLDSMFPLIDCNNYPLLCPICNSEFCTHNEELLNKQEEFKGYEEPEEAVENSVLPIKRIVKMLTGRLETAPVEKHNIKKKTRLSTTELNEAQHQLDVLESSGFWLEQLERMAKASTMKILISALVWSIIITWGGIGIFIYVSKGGKLIGNENTSAERAMKLRERTRFLDQNYDRDNDGRFTSKDWWMLTPAERFNLFKMGTEDNKKE